MLFVAGIVLLSSLYVIGGGDVANAYRSTGEWINPLAPWLMMVAGIFGFLFFGDD